MACLIRSATRRQCRDHGRTGSATVLMLVLIGVAALVLLVACTSSQQSASNQPAGRSLAISDLDVQETVNTYCVVCHNEAAGTADLAFDTLDVSNVSAHPATWEKVITKLRTGTMPPSGMPRPDAATYAAVATWLETELDGAWAANPNPGRMDAVHRLNGTEYNNAIRDLLALEVDVRSELPGDETADGSFDNLATVLSISTSRLNRYMSVARKVTRLAVGLPPRMTNHLVRVPTTRIQEDLQSTHLPLGSRGGIAVPYYFPADGEYSIRLTLQRNYQEYLRGAGWPQLLDVRLDGKLLKRFTYGGGAVAYRPAAWAGDGEPGFAGSPKWEEYTSVAGDAGLEIRVPVEAGEHVVGVSFPRDMFEPEALPHPPQWATAWTEQDDDERYKGYAMLREVLIVGPHAITGPVEDTPSRRAIFICQPQVPAEEEACATEILSNMARRAYRRTVTDRDIQVLLEFFRLGKEEGEGFDGGIQMALERMLVDPDFLMRVYRDPPGMPTATAGDFLPTARQDPYPLSDFEVASRLSFFLWSSIPDPQLLELAEQGTLTDPPVLREQVRRMLADPRTADALVEGFVSQWLNLRLLTEDFTFQPDVYPDADGDLIMAFPRETELFVGHTLREDRSILELLNADYTFLNERLARHYGIPNVYGSHFRKMALPDLEKRGGILGNAGILALSSYPNRTSPVLRGKWLLNNILGTPTPEPPSNVDTTLEEDEVSETASIRERLARHRDDPVCASCHSQIDPLGFALENYDVVGGWRTADEKGNPVDNMGTWPNGREINGFVGLRELLLDQHEQFVSTVTAKLMSYALGRKLEYYDQPAVRKIVRGAAAHDYRWSSVILGIVESPAFLMRAPETD